MERRRKRGRGKKRNYINDHDYDDNFPPYHGPPPFRNHFPHFNDPYEPIHGPPPHFGFYDPYRMFHHGPPHWPPHWGPFEPYGHYHGPGGHFHRGPHDFFDNDEHFQPPNYNFQTQIPRNDFLNEQMRQMQNKESDLKSNITINLNFKDNENPNINNQIESKGALYGSQNINNPQTKETTFNPIQIINNEDKEMEEGEEEFSLFSNSQTKSKVNQTNKQKNEERYKSGNEFPAQPVQFEQDNQAIDPENIHEHELNYSQNLNNICTICYSNIENKSGYKCDKCDVVLCEDYSNQVFGGEKRTTIHPHQLLLTNRNNWSCDICKNSFKKASSFCCKKCNFDACYSCYIIPN